jgi:hypothetical protein
MVRYFSLLRWFRSPDAIRATRYKKSPAGEAGREANTKNCLEQFLMSFSDEP